MIEGLTINESIHVSDNGSTGKIAVFIYSGDRDPSPILDYAVREYVGDEKNYIELIDAHLNCPWMRSVISNVNEMSQTVYDGSFTLKSFKRNNAIDTILDGH